MGRFALLRAILVVAVFALAASCSGGNADSTAFDGDDDGAIQTAARAEAAVPGCRSGESFSFSLLDPRELPFPSDLFTFADPSSPTGLRLDMNQPTNAAVDRLLESSPNIRSALNHMTGFGVNRAVFFPATTAPDRETLAGNAVCLRRGADGAAIFEPVDVTWIGFLGVLAVKPHFPLMQGTEYVFAVIDGIRTEAGACYASTDDFRYVSGQPIRHPRGAGLGEFRTRLSPMFGLLAEAGFSMHEVVAATSFTTQAVTHDAESVRDQLARMAEDEAPRVKQWTHLGDADEIDSVWDATYDTVEWRADDLLVYDAAGDPVPQGFTEIVATVSLPDPSKHAQPFPVAVFLHGMAKSRDDVWEIGPALAEAGVAMVGFDLVYHGTRGGGRDVVSSVVKLFNYFHPLKLRGNAIQTVADAMWAGHLVRGLDDLDLAPHAAGGDGVPDLDTSRVALIGASWGAITGGMAATVDHTLDTFVLTAGAADFFTVMQSSAWGEIVFGLVDSMAERRGEHWVEFFHAHNELRFILVDGADPAGYLPYLIRNPLPGGEDRTVQVLHQMSAADPVLGGLASGEMARIAGLTQIEPFVWPIADVDTTPAPFAGPATYQYAGNHHRLWALPEARRQVTHFFQTWNETGVGEVIDPLVR